MNLFRGFLVLFLCFSSQMILVNAHDCDSFTFSQCDVESNLVWQNDQVNFPSKIYFYMFFLKRLRMLNCARQHVQQFPPATIFCLIMMFVNFTGKTFQCFAKIY